MSDDVKTSLQNLKEALEVGRNKFPPSKLTNGAPLIVEDLDLAEIGMYSDKQKEKLLAEGVLEDDFFLKTLTGTTMWARKSDEGKKWWIYEDTELKLWKNFVKKD